MNKIIVVGAGTMGAGIAQVAAAAGYTVVLNDIADEYVGKGLKTIQKNLSRSVEKGKLTQEQMDGTLGAIKGVVGADDLANEAKDADLVIEAIIENMEIKKKFYRELDAVCPAGTILASNTSALSISELAAATQRPDRFAGLHFFNPAPVMQLVEIVAGAGTSPEVIAQLREFVEKLGKVPVNVTEAPGFVVNRMLVPLINEAAFVLMEGVASAEDIDTAMRLGANHPIGPLALADLIGVDVCLAVMETLYSELGDPKYRPCPMMRKMVRGGLLGRKTGQGFFKY